MKVIIAGSRSITEMEPLLNAIDVAGFEITEVVSGGAAGVDRSGEKWAKQHNVPVTRFKPDWEQYGKRAGYMRNELMAEYGEALIAVWDGRSRGTAHMMEAARKLGLPLVYTIVNKKE